MHKFVALNPFTSLINQIIKEAGPTTGWLVETTSATNKVTYSEQQKSTGECCLEETLIVKESSADVSLVNEKGHIHHDP